MGEVFLAFLKLGCTSFGGPIAHLGYFREEFVARRKWLDDKAYADLVALCNFLPGPASSQVGIALGISRAGLAGGAARPVSAGRSRRAGAACSDTATTRRWSTGRTAATAGAFTSGA